MNANKYYPLTDAQKRIWYSDVLYPHSGISNIGIKAVFNTQINKELLIKSIYLFVNSEEAMRVNLREQQGFEPHQYVEEFEYFDIPIIDMSDREVGEIDIWLLNETKQNFELYDKFLFDFKIIEANKGLTILFGKFHHIILDGISSVLLLNNILHIYTKLLENEQINTIPKIPLGYINMDEEYEQSKRFIKDQHFWQDEFKTIPDYIIDQAAQLYRGNIEAVRKSYKLPIDLQQKLLDFCEDYDLSIQTLFTSLLFIYMYRTTNHDDLIIGTNFSNRDAKEKKMLGMFVSTTPFRMKIDPKLEAISFIKSVRKKQMRLLRHQKYPYNRLLTELRDKNDDISQLFTIGIEYQELPVHPLVDESEDIFCGFEPNEFTIHIKKQLNPEQIFFNIDYRTELFNEEDIEQLMERFFILLEDIIAHPERKIGMLEICGKIEKEQVLSGFNSSHKLFSTEQVLQEYFEQQAKKIPNRVAVSYKNQQLTYKELNERANCLAWTLRKYGAKREDRVAVIMDRSIEMIVGILAILKSGAAYVPIDPEYPEKRINYILKDSHARFVLTSTCYLKKLKGKVGLNSIWLDVNNEQLYKSESSNPDLVNKPNDLAYIIYTSGTTGKPKGVMIEHQSVPNLILYLIEFLSIDETDKIAQFASISFDVSVEEMWLAFFSGAKLYVIPTEEIEDYTKFEQYVNQNELTILQLPPAYLKHLTREHLKSVRKIIVGGAVSTVDLVKKWKDVFVHVYGATEATVDSTIWSALDCKNSYQSVPVGKPIANTQIYILNEFDQAQPIGAPGEICISGKGLARGYLNQQELTESKFVDNPFIIGERMYRTGDLGRWLPDGTIEFLGRLDQQVKIRGYRVELAEIETVLSQHDSVYDVTVLDHKDSSDETYLCAYIVGNEQFNKQGIKEYLERVLPSYMIPSHIIKVDSIPLTPNGKVNRKELPIPNENVVSEHTFVAPNGKIEKELINIWSSILDVDGIGVTHDFFELGGHSLHAIRLMAEIRDLIGVEIPVRNIFEYRTIRKLANFIEQFSPEATYSILPVSTQPYYPASSAQKRIYFLHQMSPLENHYNIPFGIILEGSLDIESLENAFTKLIDRHEGLRTSFDFVDGEPVQRIAHSVEFILKHTKMSESDLLAYVKEFIQPFDLRDAPLFRAEIVSISSDKHILLVDMHHIISDGVSIDILLGELSTFYNQGDLPYLAIQYKDYAVWQKEFFESDKIRKQEEYWLKTFSEGVPTVELPVDYARPVEQTYEGELLTFYINKPDTDALKLLSIKAGTTMYMTLLAIYNVLLNKYTNQTDIVVGTPIIGRATPELNSIIGMFVNTLPVRNQIEENNSFYDFLSTTLKERVIQVFENQDYPFELLVEKLNLPREINQNPIFNTVFGVQDFKDLSLLKFENLDISQYHLHNPVSKFDLSLLLQEKDGEIECLLEYRTTLFKRETMERFSRHFQNCIKEVIDNPNKLISEIDILGLEEKLQLLNDWNNTKATYSNKLIHQLFEERAIQEPNQIAVINGEEQLTYQELNERANYLAWKLRRRSVKPDACVALIVDRSLEMIIGILGILKAGGAYVPIDPEYPIERIQYMLDDCKADIIISQSEIVEKIIERIDFSGECIEIHSKCFKQVECFNPPLVNKNNDLAYIIYTSGTTGKPKGTMIEHNGVVNMINHFIESLEVGKDDRIGQFASISFDASVMEIWTALLSGTALVLIPKSVIADYLLFEHYIEEHRISIMLLPPTFMKHLNPKKFKTLRKVIAAGSASQPDLVKEWGSLYMNGYGPTETTVMVTTWKDEKLERNLPYVPIGRPIMNTKIYILNKQNQLQPIGIPGEIYISGVGLSRGYLNLPELTKEKFIDNPFIPGTKMYKTGDLGRWLSDGNIEYLGRLDHQVKIRGFRVELGEIEKTLSQHPLIKDAVVIAHEDLHGENYLCAYLVAKNQELKLNMNELKEYLAGKLPSYMLPSFYLQLDSIPLTANDKVDREALPLPNNNLLINEYVAPKKEFELKLVEIWEKILGINQIGISQSFFELGGHSLHVIRLAIEIQKEFGLDVPVQAVFNNFTIKQLASYLEELSQIKKGSIEVAPKKAFYPLSSAQKRLYILHRLTPDSIHYNIPCGMIMEGPLDFEVLKRAMKQLIDRHDSFRTSFELIDNEPVQLISTDINFDFPYLQKSEEQLNEEINDFIKPFDLHSAPLLRAKLIKVAEEKHVLLLDMHHIISDGTSINILLEELIKLYNGEELAELRIQYKDYSVWQKEHLATKEIQNQEKYWLKVFSDTPSTLELPTDFPRPLEQDFKGDVFEFCINETLTKRLKHLIKESKTTLYMTLLSAFNVLLFKYTNKTDIVVGTPIIGRTHFDVQSMIGMFVNTLAMRNRPEGDKTFIQFLNEVKEQSLMAYDNQDYPFELLVENIELNRDLSRNPLFNILFSVQDFGNMSSIEMDNLVVSPLNIDFPISKFDLTLMAREKENEIVCSMEYSTALFKQETIESLAAHFIKIIGEITLDPTLTLDEIPIVTKRERDLLEEWNATKLDFEVRTIHELFEEQVEKTPNHIAIVCEQEQLTYSELNNRANRLARTLRMHGVRSNKCVALMVERSLDMVVGILAILKAGGAYVPIDLEYPVERIQYMLENSEAKWVLSENDIIKNITGNLKLKHPVEWLDIKSAEQYHYNGLNIESICNPTQLAYVIYTSGTTGKPKGVMMEHRNLVNLLTFQLKQTNIPLNEKVLQFTSIGFDVSFQEIFSTLLAGGQLHIASTLVKKDVLKLFKLIEQNEISVCFFPVAFLKFLFNQTQYKFPQCIKHIITAGEQLIVSPSLREYLQKNNVYLHNHYGPSETHVVTTETLDPKIEIPDLPLIGRPIPNNKIYILNEKLIHQPIGIVGELFISGANVGRGYLNQPKLTEDKFISNPFEPRERMYRTGDLARWLSNGKIEYIGRIDHQVKILGHRVELEEIESILMQYFAIKNAAVIHLNNNLGDQYLCAFFTADEEVDISELRLFIGRKLPQYMIPSFLIKLEEIPLTSNGKVDRKRLSELEITHLSQNDYMAPSTEVEQQLEKICSEVLGLQKVGVNHNFFEIGGNSLNALTLVSKIRDAMDIELPLRFIFQNPTIKEMATGLATSLKRVETAPITLLNKKTNKKIFCFAPIIGYGTVFSELASFIDSHSLYGLDFINHENRLEKYMELITNVQKEGPYIFMGYSAGGSLAFECAKYMEKNGYEISDIIMLDAQSRIKKWLETEQEIDNETRYTVDFFTTQKEYKKYFDDVLKEQLIRNVKEYLTYWNETLNTGTVRATIHQLKAETTPETVNFSHWDKFTKNYHLYEGSGTHYGLLTEPNIKKNAKLLNEIILNVSAVRK